MNRAIFLTLLLLLIQRSVAQESSDSWTRFRGPNGSGLASGDYPPITIDDQNLQWKVNVPPGLSSPIVVGDLVILTAFEKDKLLTIAYRRSDGGEAWRAEASFDELEKFDALHGSPATSTPASDGARIVSYFGSSGLCCYDMQGNEIWRFPLPSARTNGDFGSGTSPIIDGNKVYLVRDQAEGSAIYAIELDSGTLSWRVDRDSPTSYSTPILLKNDDIECIVAAGHGSLCGYDLGTGKNLFTADQMPAACCASPLEFNGMVLFAGSSNGAEVSGDPVSIPTFDTMLASTDSDRNGQISAEEAGDGFGGFFDNLDANSDGQLQRVEWDAMKHGKEQGTDIAFALALQKTGDGFQPGYRWTQSKGLPYVSTAIVVNSSLFTVRDGGIVAAYSIETGDRHFEGRLLPNARYYASPVSRGGWIYIASTDGDIVVVDATKQVPEVVSTYNLDGESISATPAINEGLLYFRSSQHLLSFGTKNLVP